MIKTNTKAAVEVSNDRDDYFLQEGDQWIDNDSNLWVFDGKQFYPVKDPPVAHGTNTGHYVENKIEKATACDCGGWKTNTTHSDWCSSNKQA